MFFPPDPPLPLPSTQNQHLYSHAHDSSYTGFSEIKISGLHESGKNPQEDESCPTSVGWSPAQPLGQTKAQTTWGKRLIQRCDGWGSSLLVVSLRYSLNNQCWTFHLLYLSYFLFSILLPNIIINVLWVWEIGIPRWHAFHMDGLRTQNVSWAVRTSSEHPWPYNRSSLPCSHSPPYSFINNWYQDLLVQGFILDCTAFGIVLVGFWMVSGE